VIVYATTATARVSNVDVPMSQNLPV